MKTCLKGALGKVSILMLIPTMVTAETLMSPENIRFDDMANEGPSTASAYRDAPFDLLASLTPTYLHRPSYARKSSDLMHLDNGLVLEGSNLRTPDGFTSGFRVTAGFSPVNLPRLDLGAELTYRESEEVPTHVADQAVLLNTTTLGGSVMAGIRLGQLGLYAKSGFAEWEGDPVNYSEAHYQTTAGTARIQGFGARLQHDRLVSRLEFEEIDAPNMAHLNLLTASLHFSF